jgi:hypothetical protein
MTGHWEHFAHGADMGVRVLKRLESIAVAFAATRLS